MICGLVGLPVMHSVSPQIHNTAFAAEQLNGVYLPFEVADINTFFKRMVHPLTRELDLELARVEHHRAAQAERNGMH